jgi:hypothetical protein
VTPPEPGQCACGAEWATVRLTSDKGEVFVGTRCAAVLENLTRLLGAPAKRGPALELVR